MKFAPVLFLLALAVGCAGRSSSPMPSPPTPPTPPAPSTPTTSESEAEAKSKTEAESETNGNTASSSGSKANPGERESGSDETGTEEATTATGSSGASTGAERTAGLDEELDESLREFDEILLREQAALEERHEATVSASSTSRGRGTRAGAGLDGGENGGRAEAGEVDDEPLGGTGASPDRAPRDAPADASDPTTGGTVEDEGTGPIPADVGDGADDDIVARQLREAAMNEEDPELREKLWDEYRAYKAGLKK